MKPSMIAVGIAAAALVIGVAGCGNKSSSTSSTSSAASSSSTPATSSSAAAQAADYSNLLIKPSDIPGDQFTMPQPPQVNPNGKPGVAALFTNQGDTRQIGDTIMVMPNASDAAGGLDSTKAAAGLSVAGAQPQPVDVGTGGTMLAGTSPDGSKAVTILTFSEGRAVVLIEFDSAPNDPVPPDGAVDIGKKQDDAIKAGLPA
jgi:hypothetical protein